MGLENHQRLLDDPTVWQFACNNLLYVAATILTSIALALVMVRWADAKIPTARPTYLAYALVSVSTHWNTLLWTLLVTDTKYSHLLTVGLSIFATPENGVDIAVIAATRRW